MHRQFMHDLQRLRLNTAKSYAESLQKSDNPISNNAAEPLKLNATVSRVKRLVFLAIYTDPFSSLGGRLSDSQIMRQESRVHVINQAS